jgi:hypothetical protein
MNYADYWTKHHPEAHHWNMQEEFFILHIILEMLGIEQLRYKNRATKICSLCSMKKGP